MTYPDPRPVLVFGATGFVASHLVPRLLGAGARVRAAARRPDALATRERPELMLEIDDSISTLSKQDPRGARLGR
jgi:uncharacterized protein YbjT (DUF2867 family)